MLDNWNDSFAKGQLEKYGWQKGEGLGKHKHGNTKHIAVTVKNDKKGIGSNSQDWEFAWWDHLYNKSASSVTVKKDEGEIKIATTKKGNEQRTKTGIISTQRPAKKQKTSDEAPSTMAAVAEERNNLVDEVRAVHSTLAQTIARTSLYSAFVKSSTGSLNPSESSSPAPSSSNNNTTTATSEDEEEEEERDYSMKMTDAELFALCEGRTARKGGRGLVEPKGKYARVMPEFLSMRHEATNAGEKRERANDDSSEKPKKKAKKEKKHKKQKKEKDKKKKKKKEKHKKHKKEVNLE